MIQPILLGYCWANTGSGLLGQWLAELDWIMSIFSANKFMNIALLKILTGLSLMLIGSAGSGGLASELTVTWTFWVF